MRVIYEPRGKAAEHSPLAAKPYKRRCKMSQEMLRPDEVEKVANVVRKLDEEVSELLTKVQALREAFDKLPCGDGGLELLELPSDEEIKEIEAKAERVSQAYAKLPCGDGGLELLELPSDEEIKEIDRKLDALSQKLDGVLRKIERVKAESEGL